MARRLIDIRGVEPVPALSVISVVDDPSGFRRSENVAADFGLMSRRRKAVASIDVQGRISKAGDPDERSLYETASAVMTHFRGKDKLKT